MPRLFAVGDNLGDFVIVGTVTATVVGVFVWAISSVVRLMWKYIEAQEVRHVAEKQDIRREHEEELDRLGFQRAKKSGS